MAERTDPVSVVMLSKDELEDIIGRAALSAAAVAYDRAMQAGEEKAKALRKRKLHNTKLLLRNYTMFRENVEESVYRRLQERRTDFEEIEALMSQRDNDEMIIASIRDSAERTALILSHVDRMLEVYKGFCQKQGEREKRQFKVLRCTYLLKSKKRPKELAEEFEVTERTIFKDLEIAEERLSVLFFGIDGLHFSG